MFAMKLSSNKIFGVSEFLFEESVKKKRKKKVVVKSFNPTDRFLTKEIYKQKRMNTARIIAEDTVLYYCKISEFVKKLRMMNNNS